MTRRRFFVSRFEKGQAVVSGEAAHHLARVLRARPGQLYELSDQKTVWLARIASVSPRRIEFELVERVGIPAPMPRLVLLAAIIRFSRFEWLLEKATELGVSEIMPVQAARSEKHLIRDAARRAPRWEKILQAAGQQARRADVPRLDPLVSFSDALTKVDCEARILLSEAPDAPSLRRVLRAGPPRRSATLAVGPEGGWTDKERLAARQAGFVEASLGGNILRTETAVIAALAILRYELATD